MRRELNKIALIIFHLIALTLLFISVPLILDQIFTKSANSYNYQGYFELSSETFFAIITIIIASISWFIIVSKWIRNSQLELYLKSFFIAKSVQIPGLILLLLA